MAEAPGELAEARWGRLGPLVAAVLAMLPHVAVILGRAELFYDDHRRFSVPAATLAAEAVCAGKLPAWNPYVGLGRAPAGRSADALPLPRPPPRLRPAAEPRARPALRPPPRRPRRRHGARSCAICASVRRWPSARALPRRVSGPAVSWLTSGPYLITLSFFPWALLAARRLGRGEGTGAPLGVALGLSLLGGTFPARWWAARWRWRCGRARARGRGRGWSGARAGAADRRRHLGAARVVRQPLGARRRG
jgi:hypothetical protein